MVRHVTFPQSEWSEGHRLAAAMNFRWPQMVPTPLKQVIPSAGSEGLQLMRDMMLWDPEKRPSAQQVGPSMVLIWRLLAVGHSQM